MSQHGRFKHTETRREKQSPFQMACSKKRKVDSENRAFNDICSYWTSLKCNWITLHYSNTNNNNNNNNNNSNNNWEGGARLFSCSLRGGSPSQTLKTPGLEDSKQIFCLTTSRPSWNVLKRLDSPTPSQYQKRKFFGKIKLLLSTRVTEFQSINSNAFKAEEHLTYTACWDLF